MAGPDDAVPAGEVLAGSVGFLLSKLGHHSAARFAATLQPFGINPGHMALLRYVEHTEGQSQQALAGALELQPSRMVAFVDELEERGLVERRRNPADRRAHALHLTAEGRKLLADVKEVADDYERQLCRDLTEKERDQLLVLLRKVAAGQGMPIGVHPGLNEGGSPPSGPADPSPRGGTADR